MSMLCCSPASFVTSLGVYFAAHLHSANMRVVNIEIGERAFIMMLSFEMGVYFADTGISFVACSVISRTCTIM
jgi:hypothetical protein